MVAFIGRSNVGKSTLMNNLLSRKKLVKTSGTPGKTQLINAFLINNSFYLIDLPGYGFAKVPERVKNTWKEMIMGFLFRAENLKMIFQLVDIRHEPSREDIEFFRMLEDSGMPYTLVANKADKIKKGQYAKQISIIKKKLAAGGKPVVHSSQTTEGKAELLKVLEESVQ